MKKPVLEKEIKVLSLLDVLNYLNEVESQSISGDTAPSRGSVKPLPCGGQRIKKRIWNRLCDTESFGNDRYHRWLFNDDMFEWDDDNEDFAFGADGYPVPCKVEDRLATSEPYLRKYAADEEEGDRKVAAYRQDFNDDIMLWNEFKEYYNREGDSEWLTFEFWVCW